MRSVSRDRGPDAMRIYDSVRTAHLERFAEMVPAWVLYQDTRYDFDLSLAPDRVRLRKAGRLDTLRWLINVRPRAVEVSEPSMTTRWLDLAAQLAMLRLLGLITRQRVRVATYCIGVTDPADELQARRRVPLRLGRIWSRFVLRMLVRSTDRIAFGTPSARELLSGYVSDRALRRREQAFPAVPTACGCPAEPRHENEVLFLGAFIPRKGIGQLLDAWDALPDDHGLRLRLIGKGELAEAVTRWAAGRADVEVTIDPPRQDIHSALRRAHVLALPSQRVGTWREQVGLPIVEGLAHGCEIVTTTETGLAPWLAENGHRVIRPDSAPAMLAAAVRKAAADSRDAAAILRALPDEDSRIAADRWMLGEG